MSAGGAAVHCWGAVAAAVPKMQLQWLNADNVTAARHGIVVGVMGVNVVDAADGGAGDDGAAAAAVDGI